MLDENLNYLFYDQSGNVVSYMPKPMPRRKFLGWSEIWRDDSTRTHDLYICFIRVWRYHGTHSTALFE